MAACSGCPYPIPRPPREAPSPRKRPRPPSRRTADSAPGPPGPRDPGYGRRPCHPAASVRTNEDAGPVGAGHGRPGRPHWGPHAMIGTAANTARDANPRKEGVYIAARSRRRCSGAPVRSQMCAQAKPLCQKRARKCGRPDPASPNPSHKYTKSSPTPTPGPPEGPASRTALPCPAPLPAAPPVHSKPGAGRPDGSGDSLSGNSAGFRVGFRMPDWSDNRRDTLPGPDLQR